MKNNKVIFWSITVALGGFLFGFDTAVISGAEQAIQKVWGLNEFEHGLTVSMALFGTVLGAMFGGIPSDRLGRKMTLFWIAIFYFVSALGSALAFDWYTFLFFRFLGGLGVGASSVAAPMYISEISPAHSRGRLVALFQFNIVFGILIAYLSNYLIAYNEVYLSQFIGEYAWRWMLGVETLPALVFVFVILWVPRSPRWLVTKLGKTEEAREILSWIDETEADEALEAIVQSHDSDDKGRRNTAFFSTRYQRPIMLAVLFAVFNQISGINAIIYYAPRILEMTGLGKNTALLSTFGIGLVNFVFTLLGLNLIDRFGRRILMMVGSFGLIATLGLVSSAFYNESFSALGGYLVPLTLFVYIAFFAFSQGAVIWVFISEIFPNDVRAYGQALGSFTHWIMAFLIALSFPYITKQLGGGNTFLFFTFMMVLQLLFVWKVMPETKGISLEDLEQDFVVPQSNSKLSSPST